MTTAFSLHPQMTKWLNSVVDWSDLCHDLWYSSPVIDGSTSLTTDMQTLLITCQEGCGEVFQERLDLDITHHSHSFKPNMGYGHFSTAHIPKRLPTT